MRNDGRGKQATPKYKLRHVKGANVKELEYPLIISLLINFSVGSNLAGRLVVIIRKHHYSKTDQHSAWQLFMTRVIRRLLAPSLGQSVKGDNVYYIAAL